MAFYDVDYRQRLVHRASITRLQIIIIHAIDLFIAD